MNMGKRDQAAPIRSRIVGEGYEEPGRLLANPANWRRHPKHQLEALEGALDAVGWVQRVIVNRTTGHMVDGHARVELAQRRAEAQVPVLYVELTADEERIVLATLDPLGGLATTDQGMLDELLGGLASGNETLDEFLAGLHSSDAGAGRGRTEPDDVPPVDESKATSKRGDVWVLGSHRVMCGDSLSAEDVAALMAGLKGQLLHADPPYGMGKQADGVANDNLYREKLDAFQLGWWKAFRPHLDDNASAYVWGNAPDLWRLWYSAGLGQLERLELRNEIVWDKTAIAGMASPDLTQYPEASERCLFFQFGQQFIGNINADDFPDKWEPLRAYMAGQAEAAGVKPGDVKRVCGCGMFSHWFTRSQFTLIPVQHYASLAAAFPGYFAQPWPELKAEWDRVKGSGRQVINGKLDGSRSYFDNAHDAMTDVWRYPRVLGEERHQHATPKPVAMIERAVKSSCPAGAIVVEPFGGSGSTLIAAHRLDRRCFTMELQPFYVDVIVRRWQAHTGETATLEATGAPFAAQQAG